MRERLHRILLDRLGKADGIDWERASLDSAASVAAPGGGPKTGPNPTDKGKSGSPGATLWWSTGEASLWR